ncbi:MAG: hypothetical protein HC930_05115 [Hydrococcus sp. SU_1_0]|nr:hypothetical protein [Hydrococcus sp. SU_1_0]
MWKVEYTRRFLKELASLPKDTQSRVESIVFSELKSANPFELGYLKKMKGYAVCFFLTRKSKKREDIYG